MPENFFVHPVDFSVAQGGVDGTFSMWIRRTIRMRVVMNIVHTLSEHVFRLPAEDLHSGGIPECGPAIAVESVDSFSGSIEYQLVRRAQAPQLIERPIEIRVAGDRQGELKLISSKFQP
jgi:hypothetical protein